MRLPILETSSGLPKVKEGRTGAVLQQSAWELKLLKMTAW